MSQYDNPFKIIILGDSGVGKTCLLMRFSDNQFTERHRVTVGMDRRECSVEFADWRMGRMLQVWDTSDDERFKLLKATQCRSAHGILLVYDITSSKSFQNIDGWMKEIRRLCPDKVTVLLVGNKSDDPNHRQVSMAQGFNYAHRQSICFEEVSAKSGRNVYDIFSSLAMDIYTYRRVHYNPFSLTSWQEEEDAEESLD
uniref:RT03012p n=1 Tax=Drosophila melanogaster TaxID=7227 RepID=Q9W2S9_DROME|eukprot:NP_572642.1 Rab at 9Db [Drosophila melanogaster]